MELQALLVLCGLGVVVIAVLLLMGLFSAAGTSYEEAVAQQRKATTELLALAENKSKPKKNLKKANKKLAKKEKKETSAAVTSSELESEAPAESGVEDDPAPPVKSHVEFSPPVVVDLPRDAPPNVKIPKRGKDTKVKPILLNKEDPSCFSDPSSVPVPADTTVTNHFEELHPKDDFELLHSTLVADKTTEKIEETVEKKESKAPKPKPSKGAIKAVTTPEVKESKDDGSQERRNSSELPKEQRKAKKVEKKPALEEPVVDVIRDEVVPPLNPPQPTELTTEKLLKHALGATPPQAVPPPSTPPTKSKKKKPEPNVLSLMAGDSSGVNVGELVRVVREAVLSRTEIQILTDALLNKQHDPLPEHSEWTEGPNDPVQKLKKQLADKEKALADEVEASQALQAKLKELRGNLNAERARAASVASAGARAAEQERARSEQAAAAARAELHTLQARLQRLLDENRMLAQEKVMMQAKMAADAEAQAQRAQMEIHIQRLSESEAALVLQLTALQGELNAHAQEAVQARMELNAARESLIMAQQHAAELAQQLQDSNRARSELDQHTQGEIRQSQEKLAELQNEVQNLTNQVDIAESSADKLRGELENIKIEGEKLKEETEKQKHQLTSKISTLSEQLSLKESELAELKQMQVVPPQNGLPASAESQQQKTAELAKIESVVQALRIELEAAQKSNREQHDQLQQLNEQLRTYQDKNNELRTKNWKVMEALQSAEKALQMKSARALPAQDSLTEAVAKAQEAQYQEVAEVLRAVCPSAAPDSAVGRDWLQAYSENLKKQLQKTEVVQERVKIVQVSAPPVADDRLYQLKEQNEHLQSLVDKYKTVIDDTEGVLCRLQQHVTSEEERWARQLAEKQHELDDLRHRTVLQMQKKIDSLQSDLQRATSANQNHSFADAERLTQERLMMDLSNKHMDVHNGPMQTGLEEK